MNVNFEAIEKTWGKPKKDEKWVLEKLEEWLKDENNQKYSQFIYNYSINNWVLDKIQELKKEMR